MRKRIPSVLVLSLIMILSGCIGQYKDGSEDLPVVPLEDMVGKLEYHYEERMKLQGYVIPDRIVVSSNGEEMLCRLATELNQTAPFVYILTHVLDVFGDPPLIPKEQYDHYMEITGKVKSSDWLGFYFAYWDFIDLTITEEPSDIITVTETVTISESMNNETLYWIDEQFLADITNITVTETVHANNETRRR